MVTVQSTEIGSIFGVFNLALGASEVRSWLAQFMSSTSNQFRRSKRHLRQSSAGCLD